MKTTESCYSDDDGLRAAIYEVVFASISRIGSKNFDKLTLICDKEYKEKHIADIQYNLDVDCPGKEMSILKGETVKILDKHGNVIEEI